MLACMAAWKPRPIPPPRNAWPRRSSGKAWIFSRICPIDWTNALASSSFCGPPVAICFDISSDIVRISTIRASVRRPKSPIAQAPTRPMTSKATITPIHRPADPLAFFSSGGT